MPEVRIDKAGSVCEIGRLLRRGEFEQSRSSRRVHPRFPQMPLHEKLQPLDHILALENGLQHFRSSQREKRQMGKQAIERDSTAMMILITIAVLLL